MANYFNKKKHKSDEPEVIDHNPRFYNSIGKNTRVEKTGRPTELTYDLIDTVVMALRTGAYVETAMNFVGVDRARFYEWNKKAMEEKLQLLNDVAIKIQEERIRKEEFIKNKNNESST